MFNKVGACNYAENCFHALTRFIRCSSYFGVHHTHHTFVISILCAHHTYQRFVKFLMRSPNLSYFRQICLRSPHLSYFRQICLRSPHLSYFRHHVYVSPHAVCRQFLSAHHAYHMFVKMFMRSPHLSCFVITLCATTLIICSSLFFVLTALIISP